MGIMMMVVELLIAWENVQEGEITGADCHRYEGGRAPKLSYMESARKRKEACFMKPMHI